MEKKIGSKINFEIIHQLVEKSQFLCDHLRFLPSAVGRQPYKVEKIKAQVVKN